MVQVGCFHRDLKGKTYAFLWQVVLLTGANYFAMRAYLGRIRSLTTDFGTEHLMRDAPDWLAEFLTTIGAPLPPGVAQQKVLLPRALLSPGWHHICDGVLRFGLSTFDGFPK